MKTQTKAFLADVLKLLGNSAYGKLIKAKERQTRVIYTKHQHVVNQAKWSAWFDDLEEIGDVFKIVLKGESDDQQAVYRLANWPSCECCSFIMIVWTILSTGGISSSSRWTPTVRISWKTLEEAVFPEVLEEFQVTKMNWFTWDKWSNCTPYPWDSPLQQMLLHGEQREEQSQAIIEEHVPAVEQAHGSDTRKHWMEQQTKPQTRGSRWRKARSAHIPKTSWGWLCIMTNSGCCWTGSRRSLSSITYWRKSIVGGMASSSSRTNPRFGPSCR